MLGTRSRRVAKLTRGFFFLFFLSSRYDDCYLQANGFDHSLPLHESCWTVARRVAGKDSLRRLHAWLATRAGSTRIQGVHYGGKLLPHSLALKRS
jgi:hypothetical protein